MIDEAFDGDVLVPVGRLAQVVKLDIEGTIEEVSRECGIKLQPDGRYKSK